MHQAPFPCCCRCTVTSLTAGACLPGVYTLLYNVSGVQAFLTVMVEQLSTSFFNYSFVSPNRYV